MAESTAVQAVEPVSNSADMSVGMTPTMYAPDHMPEDLARKKVEITLSQGNQAVAEPPGPKPESNHNFDAGLQGMQKKLNKFERDLPQMIADAVTKAVQGLKPFHNEPAPQTAAATNDDDESILAELGDEKFLGDVETGKFREVLRKLRKSGGLTDEKIAKLLDEVVQRRLAESSQKQVQTLRQAQEQREAFRRDFAEEHPTLAPKLDTMLKDANDRFAKYYGSLTDPEARQTAFNGIWEEAIERESARLGNEPPPAPQPQPTITAPSAPPVPQKTPPHVTQGTQTAPPSAVPNPMMPNEVRQSYRLYQPG